MTPTEARPHSGVPLAASRVATEIGAEPGAGLLLDITGPGGCGKTPVLEAAARAYVEAGVPVVRDVPATEGAGTDGAAGGAGLADCAGLIDDAHPVDEGPPAALRPRAATHGLDAPPLTARRQRAATPGQRLLVAHRRWSPSPALTALGTALTAR